MVVYPHMMAPFVVGRQPSVVALERALKRSDKRIFLATQRDPKVDEPGAEDIYDLGVTARVVQHLQLASGNIKVMVEGLSRARLVELEIDDGCLMAEVEPLRVDVPEDDTIAQFMTQLVELFKEYAKLSHHLSAEGVLASLQTDDPDQFADILAAHLSQPTTEKQALLEIVNPVERLHRLNDLLDVEIEKLNIDRRISSRVKKQMEKAQREYYLSEKIKAINEELGRNDTTEELEELKQKVEESGMTEEAVEKAEIEIRRLEGMPPVSAEAGTKITTVSTRSKTGSSNSSLFGSWCARPRGRFCVSSVRPASARPLLRARSLVRLGGGSSGSRSAGCEMRPRYAATGAPISELFRARSYR
jgi:ATP-dependent Lon protease